MTLTPDYAIGIVLDQSFVMEVVEWILVRELLLCSLSPLIMLLLIDASIDLVT